MKTGKTAYGRLSAEIERQHRTLHELGYPDASGLWNGQPWDGAFWAMILTLVRDTLPKLLAGGERLDGDVPILLVIPDRIVPLAKQMRLTRVFGKPGELGNGAVHDLLQYEEPDDARTPLPYALLDVRVGTDHARSVDGDALDRWMRERGRLPLTAAEGVALATHYPRLIPGGVHLVGTRHPVMSIASIHGIEPWRHFDDQPYELSRASYGYNCFGGQRVAHCARRIVQPKR